VSLRLRPVTLSEARTFVALHHRHCDPPVTWRFGVGVETDDGVLVGVGMAGLPKARMLMQAEPRTLEVNRTCTTGEKNANSMLYGAIARAAKALGYHRLVTYTLEDEPGSSLLAAGWTRDGEITSHDVRGWDRANGQHSTLFGLSRLPAGAKQRWTKDL
jgi:hypothetical protein